MKKIFPFLLIIFCCTTAFAQKQSFDVVSFTVPKGWQQKEKDGTVQLLSTDNKTGAYVIAFITKAMPNSATAIENFNSKWKAAIADQVQLDEELKMQTSSSNNGWDIEAGSTNFTDSGVKGNVTLLCATGGGQTVSVVLMFNSIQYQNDVLAFFNSLELAQAAKASTNNSTTNTNSKPSSATTTTAKNTSAKTSTNNSTTNTNSKPSSATTATAKNTPAKTSTSTSTNNNGKKRCTACLYGYTTCSVCGGTGNTYQQEQSYNSYTKQYEYTRVLKTCTFCGGIPRKVCRICGGTGYLK